MPVSIHGPFDAMAEIRTKTPWHRGTIARLKGNRRVSERDERL